jgi:hypothetical protein
MSVCACICVYIYVDVCVRVCMYAYAWMWMSVSVCEYTFAAIVDRGVFLADFSEYVPTTVAIFLNIEIGGMSCMVREYVCMCIYRCMYRRVRSNWIEVTRGTDAMSVVHAEEAIFLDAINL